MSPRLMGPGQADLRSPKGPSQRSTTNRTNSESSPLRREAKIACPEPSLAVEMDLKGQQSGVKKKLQGQNKQSNGSRIDRRTPHSHTKSQSHLSPDQKTTPSKQAYAGPNFHSSPAASSLPMPSFYSKSLPNFTASPLPSSSAQLDGQGHADSDTDAMISPTTGGSALKTKEPSPLDFMFEAARKARGSPQFQSPDHQPGRCSPFDDIGSTRSRSARGPSSESVFPFELDGNGTSHSAIGPAFATPYRDRMDALRSSGAQSITPPQTMDEKERKEKSEALKRLLINASPLRCSNEQLHHQQGPPTPQTVGQHASGLRQCCQIRRGNTCETDQATQRPMSSHLRREFQPANYRSSVELDSDSGTPLRKSTTPQSRHSPASGQAMESPERPVLTSYGHFAKPNGQLHSAQQLEDDLRRVLKLDPVSNKSVRRNFT